MGEGSAKRVLAYPDAGGVMGRLNLLEKEVRGIRESLNRLIDLLERRGGAERPGEVRAGTPPILEQKVEQGEAISAEKADLVVETALGKVLDGIFD